MSSVTINGIVYTSNGDGTASVTAVTVDLPANVTILGNVTIGGTSLILTGIRNTAFANNYSLTSITIPAGIYGLSSYEFAQSNLSSIRFLHTVSLPNIPSETFYNIDVSNMTVIYNSSVNNPTNITNFITYNGRSFGNIISLPLSAPVISSITSPSKSVLSIVGTNLLDVQQVTVNGATNATSFVVNSNTLITATFDNTVSVVTSCLVTDSVPRNSNSFSLNLNIIITPVNTCFPAKTEIRTDQGIVHIEKLNPKIHTLNHGQKIVGITETIHRDSRLVCIEKCALGKNMPDKTTTISPNHRVLYKGKMVKSKDLIEAAVPNVRFVPYENNESLYNVLLEKHGRMVVHNLICETLDPKSGVAKLHMLLETLSHDERQHVLQTLHDSQSQKHAVTKAK